MDEGINRHVDRRQTGQEACVRELGYLGRQQSSGRVLVPLVPAEPREVTEVRREPGDVRRFREVGRAGNEKGTVVGLFGKSVDVRPPCPEGGPVRSLVSRLLPQLLRVLLEVEEPGVRAERSRPVIQPEAVDVTRHGVGDREKPICQPVDRRVITTEDTDRHTQVRLSLGLQSGRVRRRRIVDACVLDVVTGHELLTYCPELLGVSRPRSAVALIVVLPVTPALPALEPGHAGDPVQVVPAGTLQHGPSYRAPLRSVLSSGDPPPVRCEPVNR